MNESRVKRFNFKWRTRKGTTNSSGVQTWAPWSDFSSGVNFTVGRSGVSLPFWRRKIALIEDATTVFSGTDVKLIKVVPCGFSLTYSVVVGVQQHEIFYGAIPLQGSYPDPSLISTSAAQDQALRKLITNTQQQFSAFEGGKFVAEIRDTIRGLRHPAQALREGLDLYHMRAKKYALKLKGAKLDRALAGTWLEFQFGWRPLAADVQGFLTNLQRISASPRPIHFKTSGITETQSNHGLSPFNDDLNAVFNLTQEIKSTATVTLRGAYKIQAPNTWSPGVSWGIGTQDFWPSVWEAIPYSFAVDYFTNIGNIIEAYSYLPANIAWVAKTVRQIALVTYRGTSVVYTPSAAIKMLAVTGLGSTSIAISKVSRSPTTIPSLINSMRVVKVPDAGSLKWLNLAALIKLKTL